MRKYNRINENFLAKLLIYIKLSFHIIWKLITKQTSLKLTYLHVVNKLINKPKDNDDFNWNVYHHFYSQELKLGENNHTLIINKKNFKFKKNEIIKTNSQAKNLHPNHKLLYETILKINPKSILEIGCGGGDHLANLNLINNNFKISEVDRSHEQINILRKRHPKLKASIKIKDITMKNCQIESADLIYTQAVLMHISETKGRLKYALNNILKATKKHLILIENWKSHHFLNELNKIIKETPKFKSFKFYVCKSSSHESIRALVLSKKELSITKLNSYDDLLQEKTLRTH